MKTSELTGALLDYWVARAEGKGLIRMGVRFAGLEDFSGDVFMDAPACCYVDERQFRPSSDWAQGGLIIEKHRPHFNAPLEGGYVAILPLIGPTRGDTALQAICRAVARAKFGDTVPDEVAA